jgi:hypothetical protein
MSMYVDKKQVGDHGSRELEQGDVLRGVLMPKLPHEQAFGFQRQAADKKEGWRWFWKPKLAAADLLEQENKELRVMSKLQRQDVLVLSNSCDNASGAYPILLAPIHPFVLPKSETVALRKALADVVRAFAPKCDICGMIALHVESGRDRHLCDACAAGIDNLAEIPDAQLLRDALPLVRTPEEQTRLIEAEHWMLISRTATAANPKRFYMAGDPARGIDRSEVHLVLAQPADPAYLTRCLKELGSTRAFGLNTEAVRHLQYTIASFVSRNPRDDHEWPSDADLKLKSAWLEDELARNVNEDYQSELDWIKGHLERASMTAVVDSAAPQGHAE